MKIKVCVLMLAVFFAVMQSTAMAQTAGTPADSNSLSADRIIDKALDQERALAKQMTTLRPLVETYLQNLEPHPDLGAVPKSDNYFLGKLDLSHGFNEKSLLPVTGGWTTAVGKKVKQFYSVNYVPQGFASMILLGNGINRTKYEFTYVRREFLGEVRCFVFDVQPKARQDKSEVIFLGRIWIEDQDYNIVRFNGTHEPSRGSQLYFHFDSWRENMGPGLWLPAYVYTEESDLAYFLGTRRLRFKGQTRLWGYNVGRSTKQNELTSLTVESENVRDQAADAEIITPVEASRAWERQA